MNHNQMPMQIDAQGNQFPSHPYAHSQLGYGDRFNPEDDNDSIDLLKILWFVVHYRWLIAACLVTGLVCGVFFTLIQTPKYRATAQMEIQTAGAKVIEDLEVVATSTDFRMFETTREKMRSRDLANRVAYELDLANKPDFLAPAPTFSLGNILRRITGSTPQLEFDDISPDQRAGIASSILRESLTVELKRNTSLLEVSFSHPLPQYAESVTNQFVRSYIDQNVDKRSETSGLAREFIEQQVVETKEKLQQSEKALVAYAQKEGITLTGNDTSLVSENINEINKAISDAVQERLDIARLVKQIEDGDSTTLPEVFKSESIQSNKQKIAELKATYQEKLSTLKPGFPEMVRLRAQFNELQNQVNLEIGAIARSTKVLYEQSVDKEAALKVELADLERRQSEFQQKNIQYTILKREVDSNRSQYESLIGKLNEVGVGSELRSSNASIIDLAVRPNNPYTPRLSINMAIAFAFFAMLAAGIILLLELMNNTFSTPDQIENDLKLSVLGIVPKVPEASVSDEFNNPQSGLSESYRTLRTSMQFTGTDAGLKTIVVTSPEPSEGKTTTSLAIAENFANLGKRVLLIDGDLRKPKLHRVLKTDNATGLSNLLTNVVLAGGVESVFQPTGNPNLTFMSSGTVPPNPADILMSPRMGVMLQLCKKRYDMIIIDSPPVIGLSDAPILARQADATLLVIATKQATRKSAANALKRLKAAGANVVGAAMTKFSIDNLDYNYAYRYMKSNYYAYDGEQSGELRLQDKHGSQDASGIKTKAGIGVAGFFNRFTNRSG
jgi:succinoglycan biosynthesis transport protein ExoP